ncbi:MAG: exosortase-associated EpsI family protein [Chloroflexota bacterium]
MRNLLVIVLLIAGVIGVYGPQFMQEPPSEDDALMFVSDLDFWQRTNRETHVWANVSFHIDDDLNNVPLELGTWVGVDSPETNQEVELLLDPEQYIRRLYQNDQGQYIWLSMISGRSSRPFHPPDICYDADGWQYNLGSRGAELNDGGEVRGLWLEAKKMKETGLDEHIVFYFYLFPNAERNLADGIVLFKLTSPRYGSTDDTLAMHENFVQTLFTRAE